MAALEIECARIAERARSLRIRNFRYTVEGDTVRLEGDALTPDGLDSLVRLFESTSARAVKNEVRHTPPDASNPGVLGSPKGYVEIKELGPNAARLAETCMWTVEANDTLRAIAETIYGDPEMAIQIVRANQKLKTVNDHLTPGTRLRVPMQ